MSKLSEKIRQAKKSMEFREKDKENEVNKKNLETIKEDNKKLHEQIIKESQDKISSKGGRSKHPFLDVLKSDKITIDEARAYYIVICKKKPKHDKIQTKNFLINEITKVLENSKI